MKQKFFLLIIVLTAFIALFPSCRKPATEPGNGGGNPPVDTSTVRNFQFVLDSLPGEANVIQNLSAVVSLVNTQNDPVIVDKTVQLTHNGKYVAAGFSLPKGQYKLNKLIIFQGNTVKFAAPFAGSEKANLVTSPLSLSFALLERNVKSVTVQVARVNAGDKAVQFGYPAGTFGNSPADPAYLRIRVQPLIRIGEVVYDSIPVNLTLVTWDSNGQPTSQEHLLTPGTNELLLSASATKYQFKISKWGTYDEMTLTRNQMQEGILYSLGGSRQAKKLKEELTYRLVGNAYVAETKTEYQYDGSSKVTQILHYRKGDYGTPYVAMTDKFTYGNGKVQTKTRYNEKNELTETTTFQYDNEGRMRQGIMQGVATGLTVNVAYSSLSGSTGISGRYLINANYQYTHYTHTTNYKMTMQGGNMYQTQIAHSNGATEDGQLQFDYYINPFVHLNLPDVYFTNPSKHNIIGQQKTYAVLFPSSEPYQFNYVYDNDGFPIELITKYKNYFSQEHVATIKTVYRY